MSRLEEEFSDFVVQQYPLLLKFLLGHKLMVFDAEDVAQTVFTEVLARWAQVRDPHSYLYRIAKNEVAARARRQFRDVDKAQRLMGGRVECLAAEDVYHQRDVGLVRDSLVVLPPRQREVMVRIYQGYRISDIAAEIGISTATVRSNLRHGRNTLRPLLNGDRQGLHRRAGLQLYEAYQRGDPLPVSPRPLIRWAWDMAKAAKVNPERGNAVRLSGDDDEVKRRRQESPLAACSWARDMLTELGKATGQMMVVVDADGVVLWRDGDRGVLKRAERLGFSEGAYWDMQHAGANGIALALMTGRTVTVCGWEHFVQSQHHLSCVAAPVRGPLDGQALCVLNLTGTRPTIHHAILHEIDTIAMRLHRQLRTSWIPHS